MDLTILSGSLCWGVLQSFYLLTVLGVAHGSWFSTAQKRAVSNPLMFKLLLWAWDFISGIAGSLQKHVVQPVKKYKYIWDGQFQNEFECSRPLLEALFIHGIVSRFRANNVWSCSLKSLNDEHWWILQSLRHSEARIVARQVSPLPLKCACDCWSQFAWSGEDSGDFCQNTFQLPTKKGKNSWF